MKQTPITKQEEWLKVLGKGMVTLPKKWRQEMGIETGEVVKAAKEGNTIVIQVKSPLQQVPYRIYTDAEIDEFLKDDAISGDLARKVDAHLARLSTRT